MKNIKILFAEDEPTLAYLVVSELQEQGFDVTHVQDGNETLKKFYEVSPNIVILDVMMPKLNGFKVAKAIRSTNRNIPIIFLTAKIQSKDVVKGFESGANDYIRKPFAMEELLIRIKSLLQNNGLVSMDSDHIVSFQIGDYFFNSKTQELSHPNVVHGLTSKESELLKVLCENQNRLLPKSNILFKVWKDDSFFHSRSMDVFISRLRKYLKEDPRVQLRNVRGEGYKLLVP